MPIDAEYKDYPFKLIWGENVIDVTAVVGKNCRPVVTPIGRKTG